MGHGGDVLQLVVAEDDGAGDHLPCPFHLGAEPFPHKAATLRPKGLAVVQMVDIAEAIPHHQFNILRPLMIHERGEGAIRTGAERSPLAGHCDELGDFARGRVNRPVLRVATTLDGGGVTPVDLPVDAGSLADATAERVASPEIGHGGGGDGHDAAAPDRGEAGGELRAGDGDGGHDKVPYGLSAVLPIPLHCPAVYFQK